MSYALATLWYEKQRFLPGILAVTFSAMLSALQSGLLWGILTVTSIPVDRTSADIWVGSRDVTSVDNGQPLPMAFAARLSEDPNIDPDSIEPFIQKYGQWKNKKGKSEMCIIIAGKLENGSCGAIRELTPEFREQLTEPMTVVVDESEFDRLGLLDEKGNHVAAKDQQGEINGHKVKIVGTVKGCKAVAGPYVFCSLTTARTLTRLRSDQTIYLLARCKNKAKAASVVAALNAKYDAQPERVKLAGESESKDLLMSAYTTDKFSWRTQMHWLFKTGAGLVIGYAAILGLLVGAIITSQTLYAATVSSIRELAILRALGIPRWRMAVSVITQSFWVGLIGVVLAMPTIWGMAMVAESFGIRVKLDENLLGIVTGITLITAMIAGLFALRSLRHVDPASLLR